MGKHSIILSPGGSWLPDKLGLAMNLSLQELCVSEDSSLPLHTQGSTVPAPCVLGVFHPVFYQLLFEFK